MTDGTIEVTGLTLCALAALIAILMFWPWYAALVGLVLVLNGVAIGAHIAIIFGDGT